MSDKNFESEEFSWSGLFLVTGICSFLFMGIIKVLDGSNSLLFLALGVAATSLALIHSIGKTMFRITTKKKRPGKRYISE